MFYETTFENRGKQYPMYLMNRDGFSLLVMGFTGKAALEWKLKYIQRWKPSTNTVMLIQQTNGQTSLFEMGAQNDTDRMGR